MLGALGGALLSGGASLLSGLFGQSSAKKQAKREEEAIREANRVATENAARMNLEVRARADAAALVPVQTSRYGGVDMQAFMDAAEQNGFNPLTFLRSGALSNFSFEQSCTTGTNAMDAALAGQYIPQLAPVLAQTRVPGIGEVFGNALTSGASQYLSENSLDRQFGRDLFMQELRGAQMPGAYSGSRFGTVPQSFQVGPDTGKQLCFLGMCMDDLPGTTKPGDVSQWLPWPLDLIWSGAYVPGMLINALPKNTDIFTGKPNREPVGPNPGDPSWGDVFGQVRDTLWPQWLREATQIGN